MSKQTEKNLRAVCTSEDAIKPKTLLYFKPFIIVFILIGIIGGSIFGLDIKAIIENFNNNESEGNVPEENATEQESAHIYYEYISNESSTESQYFIKPNGAYADVNGIYELPYDTTVKSFTLVDKNGNAVDSYEFTYYDLNGNVTEPKICGYYTAVAQSGNETKIEQAFKIIKSEIELPENVFESITAVYDGEVKFLEIKGELSDKIMVFFDSPLSAINAGEYTVNATFIHTEDDNYKPTTKTATLTIKNADQSYDINLQDITVDYNEKAHGLNINLNPGAGKTVSITYTDANGVTYDEAPIDAGVYTAKLTVSAKNYNDFVKSATITINKIEDKKGVYDDFVTLDEATGIISINKEGAEKHGITLSTAYKCVKGNEYKITITATYSSTNYLDKIVTFEKKIGFKNLDAGKFSFDTKLHLPDTKNLNLSEDSIKLYLIDESGNVTDVKDGFDKIGKYVFKITGIDNESNAYTEHIVAMNITFNFIFVLVTAVAGLILGLIVAFICYMLYCRRMKQSKFRHIKEFVIKGSIITESYAKISNGYGKGRLYFTEEAIEFYTDIYDRMPTLKINMSEVRSVNRATHSKFTIHIKNDMYTIKVPKGSADAWIDLLINY